jgi:hypothetical protein
MAQLVALKIAAGITSIVSGYIIYKAVKIYILRRKYRHIPGPETKGFNFFELRNLITFTSYLILIKSKEFWDTLLETLLSTLP